MSEGGVSVLRGRVLAVYCFLCAIWGSTWLVIKIGLQYLPPLSFAGIRMALACLLLAPFAFRRGARRPTAHETVYVALAGFLQIGVAYALIFVAQQWIESGLAALLFATFPLWVGLLAHFFLPNEPLTARTIAAAGLGLAGVALIEAPTVLRVLAAQPGGLVRGGALVFGSAIVAAVANIVNKKYLGQVEPVLRGLTSKWNGKATMDYWPSNPWTHGAYSYWRVGQYTRFAGSEYLRSNNCHFCGEHTSIDSQGYLNGAVETGQRAAADVLADLKVKGYEK